MTRHDGSLPDALPACVGVVHDMAALDVFAEPACPAAILRRDMPNEVRDALAAVAPEHLPRGRLVLQPGAVAEAVLHLCDMAGLPNGPGRAWLVDDIARLAERFAALMSARFLRLRLDAVATNACRIFHRDAVIGRLVCTYRGQGTQFGLTRQGEVPEQIHDVATGEPILLRGSLWPEEPASGLHHRSPPIEGTGETRLVLVLDPIFDEGPEA